MRIRMPNQKISAKQQEILQYIKDEILSKGYPPAVREICKAVHLKSTSSVHAHLETLEKKGYIRRDPTKPRAIEIIDDDFNLVRREIINVPVSDRSQQVNRFMQSRTLKDISRSCRKICRLATHLC